MPDPQPSELTRASDELARVVTQLLPSSADPELVQRFRAALGDLLAATLGGATVMAAGAVVALDNKVNRLTVTRGERLREVQADIDRLSSRIHSLEDQFLDDGQVGQLAGAMYHLASELEHLKQRAAGE